MEKGPEKRKQKKFLFSQSSRGGEGRRGSERGKEERQFAIKRKESTFQALTWNRRKVAGAVPHDRVGLLLLPSPSAVR